MSFIGQQRRGASTSLSFPLSFSLPPRPSHSSTRFPATLTSFEHVLVARPCLLVSTSCRLAMWRTIYRYGARDKCPGNYLLFLPGPCRQARTEAIGGINASRNRGKHVMRAGERGGRCSRVILLRSRAHVSRRANERRAAVCIVRRWWVKFDTARVGGRRELDGRKVYTFPRSSSMYPRARGLIRCEPARIRNRALLRRINTSLGTIKGSRRVNASVEYPL